MGTNLKVNEKCIQCGSCLGCGFSFLSSDKDGSIIVELGTVLDENSMEFKTLKDICPTDAFELNHSVDQKILLDNLIQNLKNCSGILKPSQKDLNFETSEYRISLPVASGEGRYDYNSGKDAERAALREFERAMFSQIDNIILKIITEYRIKYIKPYYTEKLEEGSVYAKYNQKISNILEGIFNILGKSLPENFSVVNIFPKDDIAWKMLNKGELVSDELISCVRNKFPYESAQYEWTWSTDDMEVIAGTDWRGNTKWKWKYCYRDIRDGFRELSSDIMSACYDASDDIESHAVEKVGWLVDIYNENLKNFIACKVEEIESVCKKK